MKKITAIALVLVLVVSLFAACSASPSKQILGAWRDSTGTVGYEFKEGNICSITYADVTVPVFNIRCFCNYKKYCALQSWTYFSWYNPCCITCDTL